jgi:hypothetical protein
MGTWSRVLGYTALGLLTVGGVGAALVVHALTIPRDGDSIAAEVAHDRAKQLNERLGYRSRPRDVEYIVATEVSPAVRDSVDSTVSPVADPAVSPTAAPAAPPEFERQTVHGAVVAWAGRTYGDEKATIDVRFTVTVPKGRGFSIGPGHTAGSATRCYRYTLQYYRYTSHTEVSCPATADPPLPSASPVLQLPTDAADRLAAVLRTATRENLANAVRAAFPQGGITVDTAVAGDKLVAAVGVPSERDCIVMIRTPDGTTKDVGFDRIQLEPGETGCATALYTHPVR